MLRNNMEEDLNSFESATNLSFLKGKTDDMKENLHNIYEKYMNAQTPHNIKQPSSLHLYADAELSVNSSLHNIYKKYIDELSQLADQMHSEGSSEEKNKVFEALQSVKEQEKLLAETKEKIEDRKQLIDNYVHSKGQEDSNVFKFREIANQLQGYESVTKDLQNTMREEHDAFRKLLNGH